MFHLNGRIKRKAALGLLTVSALGTAALAAPAANAVTAGGVTYSQHTGVASSTFSFITPQACSGGTNIKVTISGGTAPNAFPAGTLVVGNSPQSNYSTAPTGGLIIPIGTTMDVAAKNAGVALAAGQYTFDVLCVPAFGTTVNDDFSGSIWFTSATAWQDTNPAAATATTTALGANPASPITAGTSATFTASVTPNTAVGTVQFTDNGVNTGTPVTVTGGTAAYTTSALAVGNHSIGANFIPGTGFQASSATALPYVVNSAGPVATTTGLSVNPSGTAQQNSSVTLTAAITPNTAAGTVQFSDNGAPYGAPVAVTGGIATVSTATLAVGNHSFTAAFTATNSAAFGNSATTAAIPYVITALPPANGTETITTTITPGALTISVPDGQVTLPSPTLDSAGDLFQTTGTLKPVTVTDNRAGNPGWTVNGQVSDFSDSQSHAINGENLGWTPNVVDHSGVQTITLGAVVAPANGVLPADTGALGLKGAHVLASAASGAGLGTAHLAAGLALNVPTSTVAGTYVATLTLTAI